LKVKAREARQKKKDLECSERLMDTGFKKLYVDITNLNQSQSLWWYGLQSFETNLKLEESRPDPITE